MERIAEKLLVGREMTEDRRRELRSSISAAETLVVEFFGTLDRRPIILACESEDCDKRLGGRGARATTYSTWRLSVLRLSPRGLSTTIVAHELSHVQVHARIGALNQMRGAIPAWFDEGLAVLVSEDERYIGLGDTPAKKCLPTPDGELPSSPFVWGPMAGKTPWLYSKAACQVMLWLEANGGKTGLLAAIDDVAAGKRVLP